MWGNVARLANRLKAEGVRGRVSMMAYSKYRRVPDFPIPDNVEVMVAERGPWTENDPSERARELAEIRAWHDKIGRKVSLWTYLNKPSSLPDVPNCTPKAVARYFQQLAPLTYGVFMRSPRSRAPTNFLCASTRLRRLMRLRRSWARRRRRLPPARSRPDVSP